MKRSPEKKPPQSAITVLDISHPPRPLEISDQPKATTEVESFTIFWATIGWTDIFFTNAKNETVALPELFHGLLISLLDQFDEEGHPQPFTQEQLFAYFPQTYASPQKQQKLLADFAAYCTAQGVTDELVQVKKYLVTPPPEEKILKTFIEPIVITANEKTIIIDKSGRVFSRQISWLPDGEQIISIDGFHTMTLSATLGYALHKLAMSFGEIVPGNALWIAYSQPENVAFLKNEKETDLDLTATVAQYVTKLRKVLPAYLVIETRRGLGFILRQAKPEEEAETLLKRKSTPKKVTKNSGEETEHGENR